MEFIGISPNPKALKVYYAPNIKLCETEKEQEEFLYQSFQKSLGGSQTAYDKAPHKDDLEFFINDINVRLISQGRRGQRNSLETRGDPLLSKEKRARIRFCFSMM